jgi:hypothetical protein
MSMPLCLFVLSLAPSWVPALAPAAAQDPVELGRLAAEQRQVAEQLRRLDELLEMLENRDREQGRDERAALLAGARTKLAEGSAEGGDLASVVEGVAQELGALRTGNALEGQAALVEVLQQLLDFLVQSEMEERERAFDEALEERGKKLDEFASRQQQLLERTRLLQEQEHKSREDAEASESESSEQESSEGDAPESEARESESQEREGEKPEGGETAEMRTEDRERLDEARRRLAEEQAELAREIEEFNDRQQEQLGRNPQSTREAEDKSREAAQSLRQPGAEDQPPSPAQEQERLEQAEQQQQEALDALEQARQENDAQEQQNENRKMQEALLNVEEEATALLERHRLVDRDLRALKEAAGDGPVSRSARARLRQAANEEKELSHKADDLLFTIERFGADSFPFYINKLSEDHRRLAARVGPPRYLMDAQSEQLSQGLIAGWELLIDAIRVEQERLRRQMEQPDGGQGPQPGQEGDEEDSPLVGFAVELQLLKRMQDDVRTSLLRLEERQKVFAAAGIALGEDELAELELLLDRQAELQLQFESMVARLQESDRDPETEDL